MAVKLNEMENKIDRTCTNNCSDVCGECQIPTKKMEKKQTAVNWLIEQMKKPYADKHIMDILDQAKQLEKQQIVDAVDGHPIQNRHLDGEQYYYETYGKDN